MTGRLSLFLIVPLFLLCSSTLFGADNNYFQHKKFFYLCTITKECFGCESCTKEMYKVKIRNNADKRIKSIYYQYYSPLYEKVVTREAVVEGDLVEKQNFGTLFICVNNRFHWVISKIVYEDDSFENFLVDGPLKKYHQEPDECDCNTTPRQRKH